MQESIKNHELWLEEFAREKITQAETTEPLLLTLEHSRRVYAAACAIIDEEMPQNAHAYRLAALYHDVGRFDQYLRYGTFKDAISCDHGFEAVKILKRQRRLANETPIIRKLVLTAVGLHNKKAIPHNLAPEYKNICYLTRDADKLDILRIMANHLGKPGPYNPTIILSLPDTPGPGNPIVLECARKKQPALYSDLENVNDFRVLLGTWFYDLHFAASKKQFIDDGYGQKVVEGLPDNSFYASARQALLADFKNYGR